MIAMYESYLGDKYNSIRKDLGERATSVKNWGINNSQELINRAIPKIGAGVGAATTGIKNLALNVPGSRSKFIQGAGNIASGVKKFAPKIGQTLKSAGQIIGKGAGLIGKAFTG